MYKLISDNCISIGKTEIIFPSETIIQKIEIVNNAICFSTWPLERDLNWHNIETLQIWKERCLNNPSELFCYNLNGDLRWKFPEKNIIGFGKIIPELKNEKDFISPQHYKKYIEKYKDKPLLEVYAGDFRYIMDASTGEIYDKMYSK